MRFRTLLATSLLLSSSVSGSSWFSSKESKHSNDAASYTSWSSSQLVNWLNAHSVPVPSGLSRFDALSEDQLRSLVADHWAAVSASSASAAASATAAGKGYADTARAWTQDQYTHAQHTFSSLRDTAFDKWDESRLREFLLQQGIVTPKKSNKDELVELARQQYDAYLDAANKFGSSAQQKASDTKDYVAGTAESWRESAGAKVAQLEHDAARALDRTKDYVYSTWDDNRLRSYLVEKGYMKSNTQTKRDEMLQMMEDAYAKVANPVWESWNESYMHNWLVSHNIIKSDFEKNRDKLRAQLAKYYYSPTEKVWSSWSDSQLRQWLIDHAIIKSDAQVTREKMIKMVENANNRLFSFDAYRDNYLAAKNNIYWFAWSDKSMKDWLVEHGFMRSDAQVKRDELIKMMNEKYQDTTAKTAAYLTWPDARLRAYLREQGFDDTNLPGDRPGLLQEVRIRWVQTQTRAENAFLKIRDIVNGGVLRAEDALHRIMNIVSGFWETGKDKVYHGYSASQETFDETVRRGEKGYHDMKKQGGRTYEDMKRSGERGYEDFERNVKRKGEDAYDDMGEKVRKASEKIKAEL